MKEFLAILGLVAIFVIVLLFPFATIWALNTLFALSIPYTFWSWLAMIIVNCTVYGATKK